MAIEMLDRLQENKLRGLEELIDSWKAANGEADHVATVADFLVDEGIGVRQGLLRLWDYHWTKALAGEVADRQATRMKLRALLERGSRVLIGAASVARACADSTTVEIARLRQFEEQARQFPVWIEECMATWDMLDRPRKPLNRARVAESQAAFERGECEDAGDILARLMQGGPLVKE